MRDGLRGPVARPLGQLLAAFVALPLAVYIGRGGDVPPGVFVAGAIQGSLYGLLGLGLVIVYEKLIA